MSRHNPDRSYVPLQLSSMQYALRGYNREWTSCTGPDVSWFIYKSYFYRINYEIFLILIIKRTNSIPGSYFHIL